MAIISIPASKSLTISNKIPDGNIKDKKIIVGTEGKYIYYSYLYFDLSAIPSNILLLSATLVLFKAADFFSSSLQKFAVYPLLKQFSTFTTYENDCPIDSDQDVVQEFFPFTKDVAIEVNITAMVNNWVKNISVNRGIAIKKTNCSNPYVLNCTSFGSAYSKDNTLMPYLRLSFTQDYFFPLHTLSYSATVIGSSG